MSYPKLTAQQTFDTVLQALRKQRVRSQVHGFCRFRGEGGTKCAVGHLIPDEEFQSYFTGGMTTLPPNVQRIVGYDRHGGLLVGLMTRHDTFLAVPGSSEYHISNGLKEWELSMEELARAHNLTYTHITV